MGAADKAREAGIPIIGGHTVEDTEPKFGLTVTGLINPQKVLTNSAARPGDALILTKPLGLGLITTGIKRGLVDSATKEKAISVMSQLNKTAAEVMAQFEVHACTDVTGFGLLGHLKEMTKGSKVLAQLYLAQIPFIDQARELAAAGIAPGGTLANIEFVKPFVHWESTISETDKILLCDAQTSGGLIIAVSNQQKQELLELLINHGVNDAAIIGEITSFGDGEIYVTS